MATPNEILQRHADRPLVQRLVRRQRHQVTAQARSQRWHASMALKAKTRATLHDAAVRPAAGRPATAASIKRLRELGARFAPHR